MNGFRSHGASRRALLAALLTTSVSAYASPVAGQLLGGGIPEYDVYVASERDVVEEVTTVRRISAETIEDKSARSLDEALDREASIVVRRGGEGVPRIDIRGLRTRHILLLVDGVPIRSTEDGNFDPSLVPSQVIESIDVTYSNSSVLYGDGPLAGVLQIRTRSGEEGIEARARGDFREGDQYLGEASVGVAAAGFDGFVAGRYLSSGDFVMPGDFDETPFEDDDRRNNSDRDQGNAFVKLGYAPSESGRMDLLFDYWKAEFGIPWSVYDSSEDDFAQNQRYERVRDLEGFSVQMSGQRRIGGNLELRSWGYVTRQWEDRARYDDKDFDSMLRRGTFQLEGTTLITGGATHGRYDLGSFGALRFAANGRVEFFDSEGVIRDRDLEEVDESSDLGAWSLGVEYEVQPVEQAGIVLGYGHAFLDADEGVDEDGSLFLAGAYYDFPTGTRIRGSAAHKLRFPSIRQLYDVEYGNRDLEPERCWCFEVGIEQRLPCQTTLAVTGYWLELEDFIERLESDDPFENRQELRNRGVEVAATSRPWEPLFLRLAYSFLDARDVSEGSPYDRLHNRPRHKIDGVVKYAFSWNTTFRAAVTWAADTLIYSRREPLRSRELDEFVLLDFRLEQRFLNGLLRFYTGVDNVLDEEWTYSYGSPQPGRVVYGGFELRY